MGGVVSRRRRAILLLGLAMLLGGLAASDVARREAAIARQLGPDTPVVVARGDLPAGVRLTAQRLAVRRVPTRYAPAAAARAPADLLGQRTAVPVAAGAYHSTNELAGAGGEPAPGAPVRRGAGPGGGCGGAAGRGGPPRGGAARYGGASAWPTLSRPVRRSSYSPAGTSTCSSRTTATTAPAGARCSPSKTSR